MIGVYGTTHSYQNVAVPDQHLIDDSVVDTYHRDGVAARQGREFK